MTAWTRQTYDTVVIGAGPAGSIAACEIARAGKSVLLVDRGQFPRAKVCGCCIAPAGADALKSIGLAGVLKDAATIRHATIRAGQSVATIAAPAYRILCRETFDSRLADAARTAGAEVVFCVSARVMIDGNVQLNGEDRAVSARAIIVADGLGGTALADHPHFHWRISSSSRMGIGTALARSPLALAHDEITMLCHRDGYLGLVKLPSGGVNAAAALDPGAVRKAGGPAALCSLILSSCGVDPQPLENVSWRGTPLLSRVRSVIELNNIYIVGDAAGYVEPFTGEGMTWAIQSSVRLARIVIDALEERAAAGEWTAAHRKLLAMHHHRCTLISQFIRHPLLVQLGICSLNHIPSASALASLLLEPFTARPLDEKRQPA